MSRATGIVSQIGPAAYRVTLDVIGKKVRADSMGIETEVPMNDLVEIAVFAATSDRTFSDIASVVVSSGSA